jgi:hypothetical protein
VGRSSAYWAANYYPDAQREPKRTAPYRDLPASMASRFRLLREGLLERDGVGETVRFMGDQWRWAWEYSLGPRKVCWIHLTSLGASGTFTVSEQEERTTLGLARLSDVVANAIRAGQRTGPLKWCWIELSDRKATEAFLGFVKRKVGWLEAQMAATHHRRSAAS